MIFALLLAAALSADQAAAIIRAAAEMPVGGSGPVWLTDFQQAEALSLRTGRPLLVFCTTPGCAPCRQCMAWQSQIDLSGWVLCRITVTQQYNPFRTRRYPAHIIRVHGRELARFETIQTLTSAAAYQSFLTSWRQAAARLEPHR